MFQIQKTNRLHRLVGRTHNGDIVDVPNLMCVRKHMESSHKEMVEFLKHPKSKMFSFVSSPKLVKQQNSIMKGVNVWCHPFKDRSRYLTNNSCRYLMMPESDFMDEKFVCTSPDTPIKHDFFYMTLDAQAGIKHKGLKFFVKMLPVLCGELNLKCLIIVYYPAAPRQRKNMQILSPYKKVISRYRKNITFVWGWQKQRKLAGMMASCRFGLFPNTVDCSPRLIPECLLRDRPVLINADIWGGWHYVNDKTGAFFKPDSSASIKKSVNFVMSEDLHPAQEFMNRFGFVRSSKRLSNFLSGTFEEARNFTHIYFSSYKNVMGGML